MFPPAEPALVATPAAPAGMPAAQLPAFAAAMRERDGRTICILDVPQADGTRLHWLDSVHARGWLAPATATSAAVPAGPDRNARFCRVFDTAAAQGFVGADAAVLAAMEIDAHGDAPVLPRLSWSEAPQFAQPAARHASSIGIYALADSAERLRAVLAGGVRTVQLRIKQPAQADAAWRVMLEREIAQCITLAREAAADLFINDHWRLAHELGAPGVHLGQDDLLALGDSGRAALRATGMGLGVSSHSLWELCRARALAPRYIACGPVWPTTTKDMPWLPQGLDNLAWWCRMAQAPVVAIGGILQAPQVRAAAASGADGVCIVRGLGEQPRQVLPALLEAFAQGRGAASVAGAAWPHPSLPHGGA